MTALRSWTCHYSYGLDDYEESICPIDPGCFFSLWLFLLPVSCVLTAGCCIFYPRALVGQPSWCYWCLVSGCSGWAAALLAVVLLLLPSSSFLLDAALSVISCWYCNSCLSVCIRFSFFFLAFLDYLFLSFRFLLALSVPPLVFIRSLIPIYIFSTSFVFFPWTS